MQKTPLTEQLVGALVGRNHELCAEPVQALSRYYLLDWLGSAIGGMGTPTGKAFLDYGGSLAAGSAQVLGLAEGRSTETAALINGALSHIVEMDDVERVSIIHPAAVIIPAALAAADEVGASGEQLLAAIAAGYEVAIHIGGAVGPTHYYHFHNTSTCGVFGAAMAAGWIYQLTEQQLVWALGSAGTQAAGLWEFNTEGAQSKPLHTGRAAANGVLAAQLARGGISGGRRILEGDRGFFAGLGSDGHPTRVVERLDGPLKIADVSIKPHASCRHTHAPVDAALRLREQLLSDPDSSGAGTLQRVDVAVYEAAQVLCDKADPQSVADAKFSLQYCVSTALLRGKLGLEQFSISSLAAEDVHRLMSRVTVVVDELHQARYPDCWSATVTVVTDAGRQLTLEVANPKGDPEDPLTQPELEQKFRQLVEYGVGAEMAADRAESLIQWVASVGGDRSVDSDQLQGLRPAPGRN